jgi:hypothetical protein
VSSTIDAILQGIWASDPAKWSGKFPYMPTIDPYLPPADDWLVLVSSLVPWLLGKYVVKDVEELKELGEGMLMYSAPMIVGKTIQRTVATLLAPKPT